MTDPEILPAETKGRNAAADSSPPIRYGLNKAVEARIAKAEKHNDLEKARKSHNRRINKKLRYALKLLVEGERSIALAAEKAGMTDTGLRYALDKPHVLGELRAMAMKRMTVAAVTASHQLAHLSTHARSEYVQLQAAQDLANRAGLREDPGGQGEAKLVININLG